MLLWIGVGYGHVFRFDQMATGTGMGWMAAVGRERMFAIGILEILGAIGLIGPAVTGILPWLTPLAAASFALLMAFAIVLHARRPGEGMNIVTNVILGLFAALIAFGRFIVAPL